MRGGIDIGGQGREMDITNHRKGDRVSDEQAERDTRGKGGHIR